jgi:hypothetical protein
MATMTIDIKTVYGVTGNAARLDTARRRDLHR